MTWASPQTPPGQPTVDGAPLMNPTSAWETHDARAHQTAPSRWRPVWHVEHLVYQGGHPNLPRYSMTGSGFIPHKPGQSGLATRGKEGPSWQPYATPVSSMSGSGLTPSRVNFLTRLFGGRQGYNQ